MWWLSSPGFGKQTLREVWPVRQQPGEQWKVSSSPLRLGNGVHIRWLWDGLRAAGAFREWLTAMWAGKCVLVGPAEAGNKIRRLLWELEPWAPTDSCTVENWTWCYFGQSLTSSRTGIHTLYWWSWGFSLAVKGVTNAAAFYLSITHYWLLSSLPTNTNRARILP